jgi:oxysterol-binding protein 1
MRIAKLTMDPQDKLRFEIHGKSSVKYHLKANHQVEAKRWYWALNNAIQWTKDEDREEQKRIDRESEALKNAKAEQDKRQARDGDSSSLHSTRTKSGNHSQSLTVPAVSSSVASGTIDDDEGSRSFYESSTAGPATRTTSKAGMDGFDEDEELEDDASSHELQPVQKDALNIAAQSVRLQLDLLAHVTSSLAEESKRNPELTFADPLALQAISAYGSAVSNLKGLIGDFLRITNDREAYWQYLLDREANIRIMWEESMAKVTKEQEVLENRMGEVEDKRKRTKRALRDALENLAVADTGPELPPPEADVQEVKQALDSEQSPIFSPTRRKSTFVDLQDISDSDSDDEEFFDAVGAGEVEVVEMDTIVGTEAIVPSMVENKRDAKLVQIKRSFKGYEDAVRTKLKLDADDRPKISLWVSWHRVLESAH